MAEHISVKMDKLKSFVYDKTQQVCNLAHSFSIIDAH